MNGGGQNLVTNLSSKNYDTQLSVNFLLFLSLQHKRQSSSRRKRRRRRATPPKTAPTMILQFESSTGLLVGVGTPVIVQEKLNGLVAKDYYAFSYYQ